MRKKYHFTDREEINCGLNGQSRQDTRTRNGRHHLVRPYPSVHSRALLAVNFVLALGLGYRVSLVRVDVAMHLPIAHEFLPSTVGRSVRSPLDSSSHRTPNHLGRSGFPDAAAAKLEVPPGRTVIEATHQGLEESLCTPLKATSQCQRCTNFPLQSN